jgi:signal transduction histidine kinase
MKKIASERFGLTMIAATLIAIVISASQLYLHNSHNRDEAIKMAGRHNIRLLSKLTLSQLMPEQGHDAILELLNNNHNSPDFAYAAVVNAKNQPLATSSTGKTTIPEITLQNQSNWVSEDTIEQDGEKLLEFRAPILDQGLLAGFIRIGYFQPKMDFQLQKLPFFGQLILPVFLLVPLAYWLIRRELSPLRQVSDDMNDILKKQNMNADYNSATDFQDFMENFKLFMTKIDQRFEQLNHQSTKAQATTLALSYQRRRIESALQSLPDAILVMDETGIATFVNSKLLPLLGISLDKILGQQPQIWCESIEIIDLLAKYHNNNHRLQRSDTIEFNPVNNPEKTIAVSAYPLFAPKEIETICGTLVVFHDKTPEMLADQGRHEFINHVAHELKSPLNVIHLYAESLSDEGGIDPVQRIHAINVINDEVERLSGLISNLLNISKIEAGNIVINRQRIKLTEFLEDIFSSVSLSGGDNNMDFDLQLPNNLTNIKADKDLLRIAVNNLLTNAVKYNKVNGKVTLTAEETDQSIFIRVSDTGCGIKESDQTRIFEKFYRSDDDYVLQKNGHGLGLALAKEIIELHHGKISLESKLGQGSIFKIELPKTSTTI